MLLKTVIICCTIVVNAEPPLNSYSFTGDSNVYDYSNTVTNNPYLRSKNSYQNDGNFYGAGDDSHKLSDHVSSSSLINIGSQGSIEGNVGNNYNGYATNNHRDEYAGYSNIYENSDSNSYASSTHATTNTLFNGYSNSNNNADSTFNTYSSGPIYKDSDFGQYVASSSSSSNKKVPAYSEYSRPAVENYSGDTVNSNVQGYRGSSSSSSYSESDHVYPPYLPGGLTSEYSFGKQKDVPYNLKGSNKYSDIYSIPSEMRFTRGNAGHVSHNYDVSPYTSGSRPSNHFSKAYSSGIYSTGKPNKYSYKYLSRYAPNSGVSYSTRERDGYYVPYGKDSRKIILIKDSRPSYTHTGIYSNESGYTGNSYRSKSGAFMNGYPTSSNFDAYQSGGSSSNYNDNPTVSRRYRTSGNPMLVTRAIPA
ncbi:probable serine/threonine-protein kinase clkA [Cataglyphis hispanica]|uniref:probable serine/threonine-protein kinase clkA n=1 Tax=Cataglyphis hispanica TaxID=1086592 RepID=UPI00217F351D|nr:probable serine/threonine-protein kinase clkA [Cataglyphis hispanica]